MVYTNGKAVKIKPEKKRPSNRKGKSACTDEVISALRLARTFFRFKRGKIPAPLIKRQTACAARRTAFGTAGETAGKPVKIRTPRPPAAASRKTNKP
jgi:hypothetical protein